MSMQIKGQYRVQSIFLGEKQAFLTLGDKDNGSVVKVGVALPLQKGVAFDVLLNVDGMLQSRMFGNNCALSVVGSVVPVPEK